MDKVYIVVIEWYDGFCDYGSGIDSDIDKVFSEEADARYYCMEEAKKEYVIKLERYKDSIDRFVKLEENEDDGYVSVMVMDKGFINASKQFVPYDDGDFEESSTTWKIVEMEVE